MPKIKMQYPHFSAFCFPETAFHEYGYLTYTTRQTVHTMNSVLLNELYKMLCFFKRTVVGTGLTFGALLYAKTNAIFTNVKVPSEY